MNDALMMHHGCMCQQEGGLTVHAARVLLCTATVLTASMATAAMHKKWALRPATSCQQRFIAALISTSAELLVPLFPKSLLVRLERHPADILDQVVQN